MANRRHREKLFERRMKHLHNTRETLVQGVFLSAMWNQASKASG